MESKRPTKRALLSRLLAERPAGVLTEAEFGLLRERLAPISEAYLRSLLLCCAAPLDAVVEGVRQDSFEDLERTLLALAVEYARASESGDRLRAARCRRAVLTGKEHARLAARRRGATPDDRARKEEMASWMLLWLENPAIFPAWLSLRKKAVPSPAG